MKFYFRRNVDRLINIWIWLRLFVPTCVNAAFQKFKDKKMSISCIFVHYFNFLCFNFCVFVDKFWNCRKSLFATMRQSCSGRVCGSLYLIFPVMNEVELNIFKIGMSFAPYLNFCDSTVENVSLESPCVFSINSTWHSAHLRYAMFLCIPSFRSRSFPFHSPSASACLSSILGDLGKYIKAERESGRFSVFAVGSVLWYFSVWYFRPKE